MVRLANDNSILTMRSLSVNAKGHQEKKKVKYSRNKQTKKQHLRLLPLITKYFTIFKLCKT